jgi:hypothetical protein
VAVLVAVAQNRLVEAMLVEQEHLVKEIQAVALRLEHQAVAAVAAALVQ